MFLSIAAEYAYNDIRDKAEGDAVGNVIGEGHYNKGQKCGNTELKVGASVGRNVARKIEAVSKYLVRPK